MVKLFPIRFVIGVLGVRQTRALFENRKDSENSILPDVVPSGNVRTVTGTGTPGKIVVPKFESKPIEKTPIIIDKGPATIVENTSATPQMSQERDLKSSAVGHQPPQQTGTQEFSYTKNLLKEERRESVDTGGNYEEQDWEGTATYITYFISQHLFLIRYKVQEAYHERASLDA